jgi:hypothetical protein
MKLTEEQLATLVLAFHEGALTAEQKMQLDSYIAFNPDFQSELDEFVYLTPDQQKYHGPTLLKMELENITSYDSEAGHPYEKLAIGQVENILTSSEEKIEASLQHDPNYQSVKKQMQFTILNPDLQIKYPRTEQLIKEIPVRKLNYKIFYYAASSAAALIFTFFIYNQQSSSYPTKMLAHKNNLKKSSDKRLILERSNSLDLNRTQQAPVESSNHRSPASIQASIALDHIHEGPPSTESIENPNENVVDIDFAIVDPIEYTNSNPNATHQNQVFSQPAQNHGIPTSKVFTKEPVTVKTFLLQKTNERLFGTAAPSTDMRYETMARYASETIGLPVRYAVEEGSSRDKVVFQLGPISIERNRAKK